MYSIKKSNIRTRVGTIDDTKYQVTRPFGTQTSGNTAQGKEGIAPNITNLYGTINTMPLAFRNNAPFSSVVPNRNEEIVVSGSYGVANGFRIGLGATNRLGQLKLRRMGLQYRIVNAAGVGGDTFRLVKAAT